MAYAFIGAVWIAIFGRIIPDLHRDHSVFVSVAERLIAGDRLYSGVWDNKDPLFYWTLAIGRWITPYADLILEILWLLLAGVAVRSISKHFSLSPAVTNAYAFGVTPLVLTGGMYVPGLTHLPAEALILFATAVALQRRYLIAGLVLSTLALEKLVLVPVGVTAVFVVIYSAKQSAPLLKSLLRTFSGGVLGLAFWVGILIYRNEFGPYLNAQKLNFLYANSEAGSHALTNTFGPIFRHFLQTMSISTLIILPVTFFYLLITKFDVRNKFALRDLPDAQNLMWWLSLSTLITSTGILFMSGIWPHHAQIYFVSGIFVGILFLSRGFENVESLQLKQLAIFTAMGVLLGGIIYPMQYVQADTKAFQAVKSLGSVSPLTQELLKRSPSSSYARAGSNNDLGHAFGLAHWKLACPRFNQYSFDPPELLATDVACLSKAKYLLVTPGIYGDTPNSHQPSASTETTAFNKFVLQFRALLASSYSCTKYTFTSDADASGYICEKRSQ